MAIDNLEGDKILCTWLRLDASSMRWMAAYLCSVLVWTIYGQAAMQYDSGSWTVSMPHARPEAVQCH